MAEAETILGEIPVAAQLTVGSERLSLFFTSDRLIVARIGKRGTGSMTALPLWSILTGGLEDLFRWRNDSARKREMKKSLTPARILAANKENFPVGYDEIVSVELAKNPGRETGITIVTRDDKLVFMTSLSVEKVHGLLVEKLGNRISSRPVSANSM